MHLQFQTQVESSSGCWALSSPCIWLFTLLSSSVGAAGEGEQEAKADRGRVPLARRRSELVANKHSMFSWNRWCSGYLWPGLRLVCRLQLKQEKFTGGSRSLGIHSKPVHLGSCFAVHLAFLIPVAKVSEGMCGDESCRLNQAVYSLQSVFSDETSVMTGCLLYFLFHARSFTY